MSTIVNPSAVKKLSLRQWVWIFSAWWRLWWAKIRLKWSHPDWLTSKLARQRLEAPDRVHINTAQRLHESVRLAARLHPGSTDCLPKSLVLQSMLNERSIDAQLCLGVSKEAPGHAASFASHAWVEIGDQPICEPPTLHEQFRVVEVSKAAG